jgi:outer membrane lipoprotein carrier protein
MQTCLRWGFLILNIFLCVSARAQTPADNLTRILQGVTTLQADFSQTIKDKSTHSLAQSRGHMVLSRPGKFRWEVLEPTKQLIVANGKKIWIYDPDLEQVTIHPFHVDSGATPALLLSDKTLALDTHYTVTTAPAVSPIANTKIFELVPKNQEDPLDKIKLAFMNNQIQQMQLMDRLGHTTVITFKNVQVDKPVANSLFSFVPPHNVDVIDETKDPK